MANNGLFFPISNLYFLSCFTDNLFKDMRTICIREARHNNTKQLTHLITLVPNKGGKKLQNRRKEMWFFFLSKKDLVKEVNPNKSMVSYTKANIWEFTVYLLCLLILFFFPALSQHISYHLLNRKSISPELNNTTVHSSLSLLWFLVVLPGARSPGEPGQTYLSILFLHLCAHEFTSLNKKNPFTYTENSKTSSTAFFCLPSCRPPSSLFAARSPGETKVHLRRDTTISLPSLSLFFPVHFSFCLSLCNEKIVEREWSKQQKNKCRLLAVQRDLQ